MRINESDEEILLALKDGPKSLKEIGILLGNRPRLAKRKTQKLLKYGLIKRIRQGIYGLDSKGKGYIEKLTLSDKALFIGQDLWDKVSAFIIDKVPTEVYQAVVRLILSEMRAKQSEIFTNFKNQFTAGWSGVLLAGKPKAIKTPIAELTCIVVGLDPEEHKFSITATKGEFGVAYQEEGGVWKYRPSPWHKKPIVLIDDWHRIIRKDARETALSLAHGSRTFIRYGQTFINHPVPFIAFNTHTKTVSETIEKIIKEIGEEYVKRLVVVNVDYIAPYLEDAAILTRKMLRSIPKLNFKAFPVKKKELTDTEFTLLCEILKEATDPDKREFFDERSVELLVLGRYALARNRDIIGTIYQTCWDRLLCLETLEVTKENWRGSFRKRWKEYVAIEQPKILEEVKKEEEREEERKEEIKKTKEKTIQQKAEQLRKRRSWEKSRDSLIAKLKDLRDNLPRDKGWQNKLFPFRRDIERLIKEIGGIRDPEKLKQYQLIYPELENEQKQLLEEIRQIMAKEAQAKKEDENKQNAIKRKRNVVKEQYQDLEKLHISYAQKTGGMSDQNRGFLESLSLNIEKAPDIDALNSIELRIKEYKTEIQGWISQLEEERSKEKRKEEEMKEGRKKEQEAMKELKALQDKKNILLERKEKDTFDGKYLTSPEKAELDILQKYQKRKKVPVSNITSFLKEINLISQVYSLLTSLPSGQTIFDAFNNSYFKKFGDFLPLEVYWAVDNQVYPLNYFTSWDRAKALIQTKIDQLRNKAITERRTQLLRQVAPLEEKEKSLKPPLYYLRTDRRLIRVRHYLGEKEDQRLHFELEDGRVWNAPKGRKWTVHTKIDYGGELLPFISKKGSTIVVQTNEGEREISENQIFCYIYEYRGPEPS